MKLRIAHTWKRNIINALLCVAVLLFVNLFFLSEQAFAEEGRLTFGQGTELTSNQADSSEAIDVSSSVSNSFDEIEDNSDLVSSSKEESLQSSSQSVSSDEYIKSRKNETTSDIISTTVLSEGLIDTEEGIRYIEEDGSFAINAWKKNK